MNITRFSVDHRPIVLTGVLIALLLGVSTFLTMSRREDPEILIRTCVVVTSWPGATASKIEELVTDPLEVAITRIDEVDEIRSESRVGTSILFIDFDETIWEIDQLFDEVRNKVDEATGKLPAGCGRPWVNADFGDVAAVCMALYQVPAEPGGEIRRPYTHRELEIYAELVETELKTIESIASVDFIGVQNEVITLEVDSADWAQIDLTSDDLANLLEARNIVAPGGQIETARDRFSITPTGEFNDVAEIEEVVVGFHDDEVPITLGELPITVRREFEDPVRKKVRFQTPDVLAERSLVLAVTMKSGRNVVAMGEEIEAVLERMYATSLPPDIRLERLNDLPRQVDTLVKDFITNLWQAIVIVLGVAFLMTGLRPALIMAAAIPLCMVITLAIMPSLGVELEQFSIASLIIALGMVVDNAIVVSDNTYRYIQSGMARRDAVIRGAHELAIPILTSTLTTVGAFLPMAFIVGNTGEYVRSLPVVVAATLLVSYAVAMMVTPIFCFWLLKPTAGAPLGDVLVARLAKLIGRLRASRGKVPTGGDERGESRGAYDKLIHWCMSHQLLTLGSAAGALVLSLMLIPAIGSQFFPGGIRDQFFVHVWLPEGSSLAATERVCAKVETALRDTAVFEVEGEEVSALRNTVSFVGMGGPRMMLTSSPEQDYTNYAHILVNSSDASLSRRWAVRLRTELAKIPDARIDVRDYSLGPYIKNAVEFRVLGEDDATLRALAPRVAQIFRETPGTRNVTDDWLNSAYQLEVDIDASAASLAGVTNADVAKTMSSLISGGRLTTYREGDHLVDVVLRMRGDQRSHVSDLGGLFVNGRDGKVPLDAIAALTPTWQPAVIRRQDGVRVISIGSQVDGGVLPNVVAAAIRPQLEALVDELPPGYRLEDGGELEKTTESQAKISAALGISLILILLVLISQYNSVLKPLIVLIAAPLALIGALVGLYVTGWALGFMPSLGIVSLIGVVINNAIILIDFIETSVGEGMALREAVARAGKLRMKPIVLTTLTTVGGLFPLALFGGPMWAGMSWCMIFGLLLSTALTLLVIPTAYVLFAERLKMKVA